MSQATQVPPATGIAGAAFAGAAKLPVALPPPDDPNSGFAAPVSVALTPQDSAQAVGSTFQVAVTVANGQDIFAVPMQIQFNPNVLQLQNVEDGAFLSKDGKPGTIVHRDEGNGMVTIGATRLQGPGVSGTGSVCTLTFKAVGAGDSPIAFVRVGAKNSQQVAVAATPTNAVVHVK